MAGTTHVVMKACCRHPFDKTPRKFWTAWPALSRSASIPARQVRYFPDGQFQSLKRLASRRGPGPGPFVQKVAEGSMPPWHSAEPPGTFLNERRVTSSERDIIIKWVD